MKIKTDPNFNKHSLNISWLIKDAIKGLEKLGEIREEQMKKIIGRSKPKQEEK